MSQVKNGFFFITIFILLFLFVFCNLLYNQQQQQIEELSNQFYTKNHAAFLGFNLNEWTDFPSMEADFRLFIEFDNTFRYFFQNNSEWSPPLEKGRFFLEEESGNKAVVGREMQDQVYKNNGVKYIDFQNNQYEVIGIIGDSFHSHVDYLILLSSPQFPNNPSLKVVVDSEDDSSVEKVTQHLLSKHENIVEIKQSNRGMIKNSFSVLFHNLFAGGAILLSVFSMTFYLRYWYEQKLKEIYLHFLLGAPIVKIILEVLGKLIIYILIAIFVSNFLFLSIDYHFALEWKKKLFTVQLFFLIYSIITILAFMWINYSRERNEVLFK